MADQAAQAEPTQPTWNPATGGYVGYGAPAPSQGSPAAPSAAQGAPPDTDEPTQPTWNPQTGRYDGFPGGAPAPKKKAVAPSEPPPAKKGFLSRVNDVLSAPLDDNAVGRYLNDTIDNPALTGAEKAKQVGALLASPVRSNEATAESIANAQQAMPAEPEYLKQADEVFAKAHGFLGVLDAYVHNPRAVLAKSIQGMVQGGGVLAASAGAGAAAGGGVLSLLGAAAGGAGAGYLDTYGETVLSTLQAHGVDLSSKDAVLQALNDPALMSTASVAAHKAGVPSAIINGLSFGLAGRVAGPVARAVGRDVIGRVAGAGAEVVTQGAVGAGGEAGTQLAQQGKITDPNAIAQAGVSQAAVTAPFMAHGVLHAGEHGAPAQRPETEPMPAQPAGTPETTPATTNAPPGRDVARSITAAENAAESDDALTNISQTVTPARRAVVEAGPQSAMEHAQADAAAHVAAQGGDALSQVVAATHANSVVGGVHDAAAVQGAREAEAQHAADTLQAHQQDELPSLETPWTPEQLQNRDALARARQSGSANEPAPSLADFLPEGQRAKLDALKAQRVAQLEATAAQEGREPTVQERMRVQAEGTPDDFKELPPEAPPVNRLAAIRAAAEKRSLIAKPIAEPATPEPGTKAAATPEEAEQPETNPPAVMPKTLAERRQAQMDAALAAKVRGPVPEAKASAAPTGAEVEAAAHEAATSPKNDLPIPTKAQQNAGNFKMGHTEVAGIPVSIEHPEGSTRPSGNTPEGGQYGYIKGTVGADGQHVDTIVGKQPEAKRAWVVDHLDADGAFQQHKVLLGFNNRLEALRSYRSVFPDNPLGKVSEVSTGELKDWLNKGNTTRPFNPEVPAAPAGTLMHGQPIADRQARETEFNQGANYQKLMSAKPGEHEAMVANMAPEEAQSHLARLDAAPGDNPAARQALEARITAGERTAEPQVTKETQVPPAREPAPRKTLTLADRRAQRAKGRFADSALPGQPEQAPYVARNRDTGEETARYTNPNDAQDHAERFPQDRVAKEAPEQGALASRREAAQATARPLAQPAARRVGAVGKEEVARHLQPMIDRVGADKLHVHDSLDDPEVPQHVRDEAAAGLHDDPKGYFDPESGEMHIFAGSKGHTTAADAADTAVHELAHNGIRSYLGPDYERVMQDVHDGIHNRESAARSPIEGVDKTTARAWLADYMQQHGLDPKNKIAQQTAADEYIAHLAEQDARDPGRSENPTLLRRAMDAVRAGLRRLGIVREWSDDDVRALLRQSNNNTESPHARAGAEFRGKGLRWADADDGHAERYPSDDPRAIAHKFGLTVEEQANHNPGYVRSRGDALKDVQDKYEGSDARNWDPENLREAALASVPLRNVSDFAHPERMSAAREFIRAWDERTIRRSQLERESNGKLAEWTKWAKENPELDKQLQELMWRSTRAESDPSRPFEERYSAEAREKRGLRPTAEKPEYALADEARRAEYTRTLRPLYYGLDPKGREIYQAVRDHLRQRGDAYYEGIDRRAQALGMADDSRKGLMTLLGRKFERGRVDPYFPLSRFGKRWSVAKDADGTVASYARFEKQKAQNEWEAGMREHGLAVDGGHDLTADREVIGRSDPQFIKDIEKATDGISDAGERDALRNEIYQKYLERLPNSSIRKHSMRRTGIPGFTGDMRRAFADYSQKSANALAQLEHNHLLDGKLQEIKDQSRALEGEARSTNSRPLSVEAQWARSIADEFTERRKWMDNPQNHPLANAITRQGFNWFLGWSPASALRILSQNSMIAAPRLGSLHGAIQGRRALWRANATWAAHHIENAQRLATMQWAKIHGPLGDSLRGDERRFMDTAADRGLFSATQANALTENARGNTSVNPSVFRKYVMNPAQASAKFLFQAAELHNRETSALAGYRLARQAGMSHEDATWHGMRISDESHFDYSTEGRPRILQNDYAKVIGQFQQYRIGVLYRLLRDGRDAFNSSLPPEQRAVAGKMLSQMLASGSLWFGAAGLPIVSAVIGAMASRYMSINQGQSIGSALASPEVDAKALAHAYLQQHMGRFTADTITTGLIGAATHAALSNGASYADLFYRPPDPNESARVQTLEKLAGLVGPPGSVALDAVQGAGQLLDGHVERALEHFLPTGLRGPLKAARFANEGVQSPGGVPSGDPNAQPGEMGNTEGTKIVSRGELNNYDLTLQGLGITPSLVANRYEENNAKKGVVARIEAERTNILNHALLARIHEDLKEEAHVNAEREAFYKAHPGYPITDQDIDRYVHDKYEKARAAVHGLTLPKGLQSEIDSKYGGDVGPPQESLDETRARLGAGNTAPGSMQ